jgi:Tfp pilus assembly protein PilE
MGQQQLLLVILVTVIVGIATVVAINTFSSASEAANRDAVTNDIVAIAASAQSYYIKPKMLNGGGNTFEGLDFSKIAFAGSYVSTQPLEAVNANGFFVIEDPVANAQDFVVTGNPSSCPGYSVTETTDASGNVTGFTAVACTADKQIAATVLPNNISWEVEE